MLGLGVVLCAAVLFVFTVFVFFFNDTATTEIYTLSLHDALPISTRPSWRRQQHLIVQSGIDGKTVDGVEGFAQSLVQSGGGVDGLHHDFDGGFGFHGGHGFGDEFEAFGADDVDAENLAVGFVGHHFDEAFVMSQDGGAAIAGEGEAADFDLAALGARLGLGEADAADARLGVGAARDAVPVDRHGGLAGDVGHGDHALARRDMGELRRPRDDVADGVDSGLAGLLVSIHLDEAAVELDLGVFEADFVGIGLAAHRHQQLLGLQLLLLAVLGGQGELDALAGLLDVLGARPGFDADLLLLEEALEFLGDVLVLHGHDAGEHLDDGDVRAEAFEDGGELHAHRAPADNDQALGDGGEVQNLDVGEDELGVGRGPGDHTRLAAGGDDDVPGFERLHSGFGPDFHFAAALEGGEASDAFHLGALEAHLDSLGMLVDDAVLAFLHLGVIEARVFDVDAVGLGVDEVLPDIGGMEQALGRDASHQETGSAEFGLLFDEGSFQSILAGADSCGVAAGTTPDDDEIVGHFSYSSGRGLVATGLHEHHAEFGGGFEDEFAVARGVGGIVEGDELVGDGASAAGEIGDAVAQGFGRASGALVTAGWVEDGADGCQELGGVFGD